MAVAHAQPVRHRAQGASPSAVRPGPRATRVATVPPRPLRLTARGRRVVAAGTWLVGAMVLGLVATVLVLTLSSMFAPDAVAGATGAGGQGGAQGSGDVVRVIVAPGDTLWELSRAYVPDRDPREVVTEIERLNDLPGGGVVPAGATVLVPLG